MAMAQDLPPTFIGDPIGDDEGKGTSQLTVVVGNIEEWGATAFFYCIETGTVRFMILRVSA